MVDSATAFLGIGFLQLFLAVAVWAILRHRPGADSFRLWSVGEALGGIGYVALAIG